MPPTEQGPPPPGASGHSEGRGPFFHPFKHYSARNDPTHLSESIHWKAGKSYHWAYRVAETCGLVVVMRGTDSQLEVSGNCIVNASLGLVAPLLRPEVWSSKLEA